MKENNLQAEILYWGEVLLLVLVVIAGLAIIVGIVFTAWSEYWARILLQ